MKKILYFYILLIMSGLLVASERDDAGFLEFKKVFVTTKDDTYKQKFDLKDISLFLSVDNTYSSTFVRSEGQRYRYFAKSILLEIDNIEKSDFSDNEKAYKLFELLNRIDWFVNQNNSNILNDIKCRKIPSDDVILRPSTGK